ncbi:MAG: hypothetical protein BWK78_03780 [Thiotrichaceae bacterium IS1]|nr:MAG: hypothetical protein BWK78_03780 [Thiotrichaceae bacterium IS1]
MKQEHIIDVISILLTIILLYALILAIKTFYIPTPLDVAELSKIYRVLGTPEPVEFMQYVLSVLCAPIFLWLSYLTTRHLLGKIIDKSSHLESVYFITLVLEVGVLIWIIYKSLQTSEFLYIRGFQGSDSILFLYPLEYSTLIFPILMILGFYVASSKIIKALTWLFSICLIIVIFSFNLFNLENHLPVFHHFNPVFYPVSQILQSKTLLVDLTAQYGLYGHFLEPIFKIFDLTVLNFSIVMALLVAASFYFIFLVLQRTVKNSIIILLGFASISFYNYLAFKMGTGEPYFQYTPIRFFFPCLILYLSVVYFKGRNKNMYYLTFIASSLSLLWNLETGVVVFLSWLLSLMYFELLRATCYNSLIKNMFKDTLIGVVFSVSSSFSMLSTFIYEVVSFLTAVRLFFTKKCFLYWGLRPCLCHLRFTTGIL